MEMAVEGGTKRLFWGFGMLMNSSESMIVGCSPLENKKQAGT
jgi:hypothetical protein